MRIIMNHSKNQFVRVRIEPKQLSDLKRKYGEHLSPTELTRKAIDELLIGQR